MNLNKKYLNPESPGFPSLYSSDLCHCQAPPYERSCSHHTGDRQLLSLMNQIPKITLIPVFIWLAQLVGDVTECVGLRCLGCTSLSTGRRAWILHEDLVALEIWLWPWIAVCGSIGSGRWWSSLYFIHFSLKNPAQFLVCCIGILSTHSSPIKSRVVELFFPLWLFTPTTQGRRETFRFWAFVPMTNAHGGVVVAYVEDSPNPVHLWISSEREPQLHCIERVLSHARCWHSKLQFTFEVCKLCVELCIGDILKPNLRPVSHPLWFTIHCSLRSDEGQDWLKSDTWWGCIERHYRLCQAHWRKFLERTFVLFCF